MFNNLFLFIFFYLRLSGRFRRCEEYCGVPAIIKSLELRVKIRWLEAANGLLIICSRMMIQNQLVL